MYVDFDRKFPDGKPFFNRNSTDEINVSGESIK